jgi:hypothetical protein
VRLSRESYDPLPNLLPFDVHEEGKGYRNLESNRRTLTEMMMGRANLTLSG